jgi:hypothetical protein
VHLQEAFEAERSRRERLKARSGARLAEKEAQLREALRDIQAGRGSPLLPCLCFRLCHRPPLLSPATAACLAQLPACHTWLQELRLQLAMAHDSQVCAAGRWINLWVCVLVCLGVFRVLGSKPRSACGPAQHTPAATCAAGRTWLVHLACRP